MSGYVTAGLPGGDSLVEGRACGSCTVCCTALKIDEPDFKKLSGVTCSHCVNGVGCSIYDRRPNVCQAWHCGWRRYPWLSAEMWPQQSGILVRVRRVPEGAPPGTKPGLTFQVLTSQLALYETRVCNAVGTAILNAIPTYLGVSAPAGFEGRLVYLNDILEDALRRSDGAEIKRQLRRAYVTGRTAPKSKSTFT